MCVAVFVLVCVCVRPAAASRIRQQTAAVYSVAPRFRSAVCCVCESVPVASDRRRPLTHARSSYRNYWENPNNYIDTQITPIYTHTYKRIQKYQAHFVFYYYYYYYYDDDDYRHQPTTSVQSSVKCAQWALVRKCVNRERRVTRSVATLSSTTGLLGLRADAASAHHPQRHPGSC